MADPTATNARRLSQQLHRSAITAADVLAVPGTLTVTAVTEAGSTLTNAARNVAVAAFNRWGATTVATGSVTPVANQAVRIAFAAVAGADGYDIFLSTGANPLWVGRITEAQRAAGGILSAVGVVSAGGAAGSIDVGIDGTGLASNVNPFAANNAWTPAASGITPLNCDGYDRAHVLVKLAVTDLRSLPTLTLGVWTQSKTSTADWFFVKTLTPTLLTAASQPLAQDFEVDVDGTTGLVVLVHAISGQGAAASVYVELA